MPIDIIDEQTTFTSADLCRSCAVEVEVIEALVEYGVLEPTGKKGHHWHFSSSSPRRTRITLSLQRDLGVNLAGAALALDLLEQIDELNARLRTREPKTRL